MIQDARSGPLADLDADVVIVGAGAAGITLALELEAAGLAIVLTEAGGEKFSKAGQDFYRAEAVAPESHGPVDMFRRRILGGSTSVWGGRCIPFDPIDFEDRPWMAHGTWPIGYDEVARHYARALEYAQAGSAEFSAGEAFPGEPAPMVDGVASPDVILDRIERFSHPTDFGKWYRQRIESSAGIRLLLNAPVTEVLTVDGGERAVGVRISTPSGDVTVRAPRTVLAAGGLEVPRLLLLSTRDRAEGLGNAHDLVGRFYQCHLEGEIGHFSFAGPPAAVRLDYQRTRDGIYGRRYIWLSPEAQRAHRLSGLVLRPSHPNIVDPGHRHPVLSAMYYAKSFIVPEYARKLTSLEDVARKERGGTAAGYHLAHMRNLVLGSPRLLAFTADWLRRRNFARRKLPSVVLRDPRGVYPVDVNAEQEPNPDSRVTLGDERDALGQRRLRIDWKTTPADHERLRKGLRVIADALATSGGAAALHLDDADLTERLARRIPVGGHHIGTARMAANAREGVCDSNGEVFGTRGLFVAGAAAFPTSGFANPTLVILALTLRLADHLAAEGRKTA